MVKRRLFIAINPPERIKNKLEKEQYQWADLPFRWTPKNNLHITLVFIGYVNDEEMLEICQITQEVARQYQPFRIELERICFAPPGKTPRMIWVTGKENISLINIRNDLEKRIFDLPQIGYTHLEKRPFKPHLTLARFKYVDWRDLSPKPSVEKEIDLSFSVESIEVMQSNLARSGATYTILESASLAK